MKNFFGLLCEITDFGSFIVRSTKSIGEDMVSGTKGLSHGYRAFGTYFGQTVEESLKQDLAALKSGLPSAASSTVTFSLPK